MSINELIKEAVVDAHERFQSKRAADLRAKLSRLTADFPVIMQAQEQNEHAVNSRLAALHLAADDVFGGAKKLRVRLAPAYREFSDDVGLLDIILFNSGAGAAGYDVVKSFVKKNNRQLQKILIEVERKLKTIEAEADATTWAAPWRRYTRWYSELRQFQDWKETTDRLSQQRHDE